MKQFELGSSSHRFYMRKGWALEDGTSTGSGPPFEIVGINGLKVEAEMEVASEEPKQVVKQAHFKFEHYAQSSQDELQDVSEEDATLSSEQEAEALEELTELVIEELKENPLEPVLPWGDRKYRGKEVSEKYMEKLLKDIDTFDHKGGNYPSVDVLIESYGFTLRHIQIMFEVSRGTALKWRDSKSFVPKDKQRLCYRTYVSRNPEAAILSLKSK